MDERLQALEAAMVAAHRAGDATSAAKLAAEITRLRSASPTTRVMLQTLSTTPPDQWESRMAGAGYDPETIAEVMAAGGHQPTAPTPPAAPDSAFTFAANRGPRDIPLRRDVSPDAMVVAPPGTAGIPSFAEFEGRATPREQGRQAALERDSRVGGALQGFGSFMFGLGVPATAASVMASRALPGGKDTIGPGEALEYARGVRRGSYEAAPGHYRTGAAAGIAAGAGAISAGVRQLPTAARSVFTLQTGQTLRNIVRLSAAGAASAGVTAGAEEGTEAVPGATGVGAVAGPLGAGLVRGGTAVGGAIYRRISPTASAIRVLARQMGESAESLAERYNTFLERMGRAPRLIEIMRRDAAEEMGQISRSKVGADAGRVFREAEEAAALARPEELGATVRQGGPTATLPGVDAELEPAVTGTRSVLARRPQSTKTAEIGARDVEMDRVMAEIGPQRLPVTEEMLDVLQHPDVWNTLDPALRRGLAQAIEAGEALGTTTIPVRVWDTIRQEVAEKAGKGIGQHYGDLRDRITRYVAERVPEYGRALEDFGRQTDYASGITLGTRALTRSSREFADALRTAGGGTADVARRPGMRTAVQAGAPVGARTALASALSGPPDKAARYMARLARDPELRRNLREVLSADEIDELETLASYYGRTLDLRAGVAAGRRVTSRDAGEVFEDAVERAGATQEGREGVERGARGALAGAAEESPAAAAAVSRSLAQDPGLGRRITAALGGAEAERLRGVGELSFRAAENLAAAAPRANQAQLRAQAAAQQVQEVITGAVIATGRASGALRANFFNNVVQRTRMSKKAARRVAELATDPDRAHEVINLLRRQGMTATEISQMYQNAAAAAGIIVAQ